MAIYIAKHIVSSGIANECNVEMVYVIGGEYPVSFNIKVDTDIDIQKLNRKVKDLFDLSPTGIIEKLELRKPIYRKTSYYGHFGRGDEDFIWEQIDKKILEELKDVT